MLKSFKYSQFNFSLPMSHFLKTLSCFWRIDDSHLKIIESPFCICTKHFLVMRAASIKDLDPTLPVTFDLSLFARLFFLQLFQSFICLLERLTAMAKFHIHLLSFILTGVKKAFRSWPLLKRLLKVSFFLLCLQVKFFLIIRRYKYFIGYFTVFLFCLCFPEIFFRLT